MVHVLPPGLLMESMASASQMYGKIAEYARQSCRSLLRWGESSFSVCRTSSFKSVEETDFAGTQ